LFIGIRDFQQGVREMVNDGLSVDIIAKYQNKDKNFIRTYLMFTHVEEGKNDQQIMDLLQLSSLDVQIGRLGTIVFEHPGTILTFHIFNFFAFLYNQNLVLKYLIIIRIM